ncbi:type IV toxin-antitoxin system AbiEi family antitoxin domain-containing protein [Corynebacterium urealyticum]|uniref:type IV toxin-antitoxin system AbiEi family antitoxin domain-containing protein n=1 Tax=Corynebacterium urealyticum TaxID=43771 RepID=UPI0019100D2C|nr:type IV toxin-antitoxin system AbiEi family antitoxin domain-containing protein [Corynebacterium urealyticum]
MSSTKTLELLESLAADQWGIITTAQAKSEGISRLQLSRLSERGVLTRTRQGLYHLPPHHLAPHRYSRSLGSASP